jgi:multiple sugar transport system substrate-binding protein
LKSGKWPRLHAQLAKDYDWPNKTTDEKFEIAVQVLRGDIEADVIELDGIWLSSFIDRNPPLLESLNKWYNTDTGFESRFWPKSLEVARRSTYTDCRDQGDKETQCLYAIPLYVDVGLLLYRKDLLGELRNTIKLKDLLEEAHRVAKPLGLEVLVFQGAKYEGLNCMFFELLAMKGQLISPLAIDTPEAYRVLEDMHSWIYEKKFVPESVLKMREEESRRLFTDDRKAVLLRNWPYVLWAWSSKDAKDVGVAKLEGGKPILGGWYFGIPSRAKNKDGAWRLIKFLTSKEQMETRARYDSTISRRLPADKAVLTELKREDPFIGAIEDALNGNMTIRPKLMGYPLVSVRVATELHKKVLAESKVNKQTIQDALSTAQKAFSEGPVKLEERIYDVEPPN